MKTGRCFLSDNRQYCTDRQSRGQCSDTHGILFLYNGRYGVATDSNGLYYMRARYYNPDIKHFINQDVIEGNITNSPSLNRYAYCQGNPVSLLDPFGLSPQISWSAIGYE